MKMESGKSVYKIALKCLIVILAISIFYFYPKNSARFNLENLPKLEVGDLVFRKGDVLDSIIISQKSNFKYSHIAIIIQTNPILILHASTNDFKDKKDQVVISTFDEFLSHALDFGIARINFLDTSEKKKLVKSLYKRAGSKFVLKAKGEENLYCTTILEQEISKFTNFNPNYTYVNTPFFQGEYLFPKAFWLYDGIEILYEN